MQNKVKKKKLKEKLETYQQDQPLKKPIPMHKQRNVQNKEVFLKAQWKYEHS